MNDIRRHIMQETIDGIEEAYGNLAASMYFSREDLHEAKEAFKDIIRAIKKLLEEEQE